MLGRALDYRLKPGNDGKFTDIYYQNLIADSVSELQKIYQLNGGLNPELSDRFRRHELEHPHRKHGVHQYSMADFGLTEAEINRNTSRYGSFISEKYDLSQAKKIQ